MARVQLETGTLWCREEFRTAGRRRGFRRRGGGARMSGEVEFESIYCVDGCMIGLRIFMTLGDLVVAEV